MSEIKAILGLRAPLRLSLAGGGTDVEPFASQMGSKILNFAINLYIEVMFFNPIQQAKRIDVEIIDKYGSKEISSSFTTAIEKYIRQNWLFSKPLSIKIKNPVRRSSGLGTSSAIMACLVQGLSMLCEKKLTNDQIIKEAFRAERKEMEIAGGFQDYFPSIYGGINWIEQEIKDDKWTVSKIRPREEIVNLLNEQMVCIELDVKRESLKIIQEQIRMSNIKDSRTQQALIRQLDYAEFIKSAVDNGEISQLMRLLEESYKLKKEYSSLVSNEITVESEKVLLLAGALGIKLSGAGGGGHMFGFFPNGVPGNFERKLPKFMKRIPCRYEELGCHEI